MGMNAQGHGTIHTFSITMLSIKPVSFRPSGLAESPLLLIGLGLRILVAEPEVRFARVDFRRCGMIRTIFNCRRTKSRGKQADGGATVPSVASSKDCVGSRDDPAGEGVAAVDVNGGSVRSHGIVL